MTLDSLHIINYKNIVQADLDLEPKLNCFIGLNGMGKTNILDVIYYLSFCKSHNNALDTQNINHEADFFLMQGSYRRNGQVENITCSLKRKQKKHFSRNKKEYGKLSDHIGFIPLVMISPSDTELITGGSEERRKFVDGIISQTDKQYLEHLILYNNALRQRNALLRTDTLPDATRFEPWEQQMVYYSQYIYQKRSAFISEFEPLFRQFYNTIAASKEIVGLHYQSQLHERQLADMLAASRQRDHLIGHTTHGIHKDDLVMELAGYPVKRTGSQGQNKTYLIALKFAQYQLLKTQLGLCPIILLDDLFDKLDKQRMSEILQIVASPDFGQIFITDTDRSHLDEMIDTMKLPAKIFIVQNGNINQ